MEGERCVYREWSEGERLTSKIVQRVRMALALYSSSLPVISFVRLCVCVCVCGMRV